MAGLVPRFSSLAAVTPAAFAVLVACGSSGGGGGPPPPPASVTFPASFMWGTSTAAYQTEKGSGNTDWGHWAATPQKIADGNTPDTGGPDSLAHIDDDVALMKQNGINAYRFSIEWARMYPTRASFDADTPDPAAVTAYTALVTKLKAAGITPLVTMIHYSLPDWFDDITQTGSAQGFERPDAPDLVGTWCGRVAKRFGAQVDWWATLNEPTLPPLAGYIGAKYPPGLVLESMRALKYLHGEAVAHARCYDAIHANDTTDSGTGAAAMVGLVNQSRVSEPRDATNPDDVTAAAHLKYVNNLWFYNVVVKGDWDDDLNGDLTGPNDRTADPTLKGRSDYIGLNYYTAMQVSARAGVIIPFLGTSVPALDHLIATNRPTTEVATDIYPAGFAIVIEELKGFGLPFVITENGIADAGDVNRTRFIAEHLFQVGWAIQRGFDIRGYFHWSLVDNFEWTSGFCPKFGLSSVDKTTGARTPRASFAAYKGMIQAGKILQADIDKLPPYVAPQSTCP